MHFTRTAAAALGAAALFATPAHAQSAEDVAALRRDMETLRQDYEARLADLETRLAQAEADAQAARAAAEAAQASAPAAAPEDQVQTVENTAPAPQVSAQNTNPNIYNPGIAVALNGFFSASRNETGDETIAGFAAGDEIGRPGEGFSMGESEVSFAANIDPSLAGFFDFSIGADNDVSLEEAYIRSTAIPGGFTVKLGRFLSGIGYLNERHAHDWSFSDAPLPYRAFLNTQLGDDGVQVRWIAPTDFYLEFGAEALRGDSFPAANADHGVGTYTAFVRTGSDLSVSSSYLASLSVLHADAVDREDSAGDLFTGNSDLAILSLIYKWAPGGNPIVRNFTLAGEYFWGRDDGAFNGLALNQEHTGWYVQGVYQFMPRWSAGLRYATVDSENPGAAFVGTALDEAGVNPFELTGLIEYDTSEFGRFRVQYSRDESGAEANDIVLMQYTVIYGPHGAHRY